jgi:hypothetical protein
MIARNSASYPFLAVAQHYGVDYGVVLAYAGVCRKAREDETKELDVWESRAYDLLFGTDAGAAVREAVKREQYRRAYSARGPETGGAE